MGAANSTSEPHPEMEPGLVEKEGLEPPGGIELHPMAQEVSSKTMQLDMYSYLVCVIFVLQWGVYKLCELISVIV